MDTAESIDNDTGDTTPLEKRWGSQEHDGWIPFNFKDCKGLNAFKLTAGCLLEFNVVRNRNDLKENRNAVALSESQHGEFRAVQIRIPFLFYRWQRFDAANKKWRALSRAKSVELEDAYNVKHGPLRKAIQTENGDQIRRITRFKGRVLKVDQSTNRGLVRINYSKEYGAGIGVWFNFRDCRFNAKCLRMGDDVEYKIRGHLAVNLKLWLIPYRWQFMRKQQNDSDDGNGGAEWDNLTYHQSIEMEAKYNKNGGDDCKDVDCVHNNESVTARRVNTFKSRVMANPQNPNGIYLRVNWSRSQNFGLRIPHSLTAKERGSIRPNQWVEFRLRRDAKGRQWTVTDLKRIKRENKEKERMEREVEKLKQQIEAMKQRDTAQKPGTGDKGTAETVTTEYKWKWQDDDGSYNMYHPDQSQALSALAVGQMHSFSTSEHQYSINKLSDDTAQQKNVQIGTVREVNRYVFVESANGKWDHALNPTDFRNCSLSLVFEVKEVSTFLSSKHVVHHLRRFTVQKLRVNQGAGQFNIPDDEYYENEQYHKLTDQDIRDLFHKSTSRSQYEILEIEEVNVSGQNPKYEVSLWTKCRQLQKQRSVVEKHLWHGSSYDITNVIITNGFDRSYSAVAAYGDGNYFARDSSYSVNPRYCKPNSNGFQYILLCKVIVGDSVQGSTGMKIALKPDGTEYDTFVDHPGSPSIYVSWRDYTAIPMYRLKFKKK